LALAQLLFVIAIDADRAQSEQREAFRLFNVMVGGMISSSAWGRALVTVPCAYEPINRSRFTDQSHQVLGMNEISIAIIHRQIIESFSGVDVMIARRLQVGSIHTLFEEGQNHWHRILHAADEANVDRGAPAKIFATDINLDDFWYPFRGT